MQSDVLAPAPRKMRRKNIHLQRLSGATSLDRGRIDRQDVALVHDRRVESEFFRGPIVIKEAVPLPFNVVELGVDVRGKFWLPAQFVGQKLEAPTGIDVAIERAHAAILAID